jgi:putative transposase|tara:strand:- start:17494 stop:18045 length:552 start_codon:yes stop_codon:yes gene_type:complete
MKNTIYKEYKHNPPHLFSPKAKYFITGATYQKKHWLKTNEAKQRLLKSIQIGFKQYGWILEDWVILNNHYHLMSNAPANSGTLSKMFNDIHKFVSLWIKKNIAESRRAKKIMHNYWDACITFEQSYFARLNYIWYNPAKHAYVENAEEWKFGSYASRIENEKEELEKLRKKFPCNKVKVRDDF